MFDLHTYSNCSGKKSGSAISAWIVAIWLLSAVPQAQGNSDVPEIGRHFTFLSQQDEYLIGRAWLYSESTNLPILLNTPQLQDYINQLSQQMLGYAGMRNVKLKVVLLADREINAFASPGGVIGINLGLIAAAKTEDELASVIAHEFAHLSQRHTLEMIASARNRSLLTYGSLFTGLGMLITGNPAIGFATLFGGLANEVNQRVDLIRYNEEEADSIAFETMQKAGRDSTAGLQLMERLHRQNRDGYTPEVFRSHPLSINRITALRHRIHHAHNITRTPPQNDNFNFHAMQIVARLHLAADARQYIAQIQQDHSGHAKDAHQLGLAIVYNRVQQYQEALPILEKLYQKYPLHQYVNAQYILALIMTDQIDLAAPLLEQQLILNPDNYLLKLVKVQMYIQQRKDAQSTRLLEQIAAQDQENLWIWKRLYEQYGKQEQIDKSHCASGHINHLLGGIESAIMHFRLCANTTTDPRLKVNALQQIAAIEQNQQRLKEIL